MPIRVLLPVLSQMTSLRVCEKSKRHRVVGCLHVPVEETGDMNCGRHKEESLATHGIGG